MQVLGLYVKNVLGFTEKNLVELSGCGELLKFVSLIDSHCIFPSLVTKENYHVIFDPPNSVKRGRALHRVRQSLIQG